MTPAAISSVITFDITSTVLRHVAAIAAIAIARVSIAAQLNHLPAFASCPAFEICLIDIVAVVATACCGFQLHACLGTLRWQKRRDGYDDDRAIFTDGNADEGDDEGSILGTRTEAAATKKRIDLLRERKGNVPSNGDAADNALSAKLDRLKLSLSSSPPACCCCSSSEIKMRCSDTPSDDNKSAARLAIYDESAGKCLPDIEPALVIDNDISMPPNPADDGIALPSSEPPSRLPPRNATRTKVIIDDASDLCVRSPLSKAVIEILPGSLSPSKTSFRMSRPLLNSHCGTFLTTLDKNGHWLQSLSKDRQQEAKSCNRPNIIEIMSVGGDDPIAQKILAKILVTGHGFGFCPVDGGEAALEELKGRYNEGGKESFPILILMDTTLPGMDGYETTTAIRSLFPDVALPIIMLTASSDVEITTFQRAVEAGANDMVTQPITKHNLMARIGCQLKTLHFWRGQLESRQNEFLLNEILPKNIITKLQQGHTGCIYDELEEVSVIFTDIVSFTNLSASHPTEEIIHMLDSLFTEFDKLTDKHGLYKVETIGENTLLADNPVT